MRLQMVAPQTFRIRLAETEAFAEPALVRYGLVNDRPDSVEPMDRDGAYSVEETDAALTVRTERASLRIDLTDGSLVLLNRRGQVLTRHARSPWADKRKGFGAEFALAEQERFYGLGDESRERLQKRGHRSGMWVANVKRYAPIPFVMSSGGWGVMINTTWRHWIDIGQTAADRLRFWGREGELDYFLFAGDSLADLLHSYTDITGKPQLLPIWAYGLTFVCNQQANAREMIDDALNMRREGIPCDTIGLEPGWMEQFYDFTTSKNWHPERFFIPRHMQDGGPATFFGPLERMGFKLSLWLCCDYDVSWEEERACIRAAELAGGEGGAGTGANFAQPDAVADGMASLDADDYEQDVELQYPVYLDTITKQDEPWYEHLNRFVRQGVSAFKLDGARQVLDHPDRRWGNGMTDEEMHNLYPLLLAKQMHNGFREQTGRRPMIYTAGGFTGIQRFAATWAGDTGGGPKPLVSLLNHGLSGHVNTSCDMDVFSPAGIHFGFLQPWSQVNSWAYWRHPWLLGKELLDTFKMYAKMRYRLLPYIYSAAHVAARTGMPIIRAMPLAFPDDPRSDDLLNQYLFGDSLLVAAFTNEVHIPEGEWIDYWTRETYTGPCEVTCSIPPHAGGPLFVRAGSIIPLWPDMDYVGEKLVERLELHVYPRGVCEFTLYEDDGATFRYESGEVVETKMVCTATKEHIAVELGPRKGSYDGMVGNRSYDLVLHMENKPSQVLLNGAALTEADSRQQDAGESVWSESRSTSVDTVRDKWTYDRKRGLVRLHVEEDRLKPALGIELLC
ncbi:MAG: xylS [Paenibacillus sp.]|nr:xylS [Paenibacillus sp.]